MGTLAGYTQSELLFTNGKTVKAYVFNIDYYKVRFALDKKKEINNEVVSATEDVLEKQQMKEIYAVNKRYAAKLADYKAKGKDALKTAEYEASISIKRSAEEEKINKKIAVAQAKLRYTKLKVVRRENVFSVTYSDGREEVLYAPDTLGFLDSSKVDVEFNVAEMRRFIKGEQDGRNIKSPLTTFVSGGFGVVGGAFGAFFGPIIPAAYFVIVAVKKNNRILERQVPLEQLRDDIPYMDGFNRTAKKQKIKNAAIGGASGLTLGIGGLIYWLRFR